MVDVAFIVVVNSSFKEVFLGLLQNSRGLSETESYLNDESAIAIGLYRPIDDNILSSLRSHRHAYIGGEFFVHIVPASNTIVRNDDKIFIFKPAI